ncbi:hypothetical protein vseg_005817 [Gypsophila vaccaria]
MKSIPQELMINILSRLPANSVGRCRCVSKPWRCLLSEAHFIKAHLDRTKEFMDNALLMLVSSDSNTTYSAKIAHNALSETIALVTELGYVVSSEFWTEGMPSCDGLILIEDDTDKRLLVNPTTKVVRELPVSPYALDPHTSFTMYGLGYDHVSDDYKVVRLSYYNTDNGYGYESESESESESDCAEVFVNVYSVRSGIWKQVESSPYNHVVGHVTAGIFASGRIHWLASTTSDYSSQSSVLVGFDLTEEKFYEVPAPSLIEGDSFVFKRLVVLGGCLSIFPSCPNKETDIWMMREYGVKQSWTKFSIVDDQKAVSEFRPIVFMEGQREVVMLKDEETVAQKMVMYDLDSSTFKDITIHGIDDHYFVGSFTETLVSPYYNHGTQRE